MYTAKPTLTSRVSIFSKGVLDGLKIEGGGGVGLISWEFKRKNKKEHFETSGY